jgi:hypothetical protein
MSLRNVDTHRKKLNDTTTQKKIRTNIPSSCWFESIYVHNSTDILGYKINDISRNADRIAIL